MESDMSGLKIITIRHVLITNLDAHTSKYLWIDRIDYHYRLGFFP